MHRLVRGRGQGVRQFPDGGIDARRQRRGSQGGGLIAAAPDADVDFVVDTGADPLHAAVMLEEGDGLLLRRRTGQGLLDSQDLVGQVASETAHAELWQCARSVPCGGDRRLAQQPGGRAGRGQEIVSGTDHLALPS